MYEPPMTHSKISPVVFQMANVVAVIAALVLNTLANALPLNGVTTGEVSDFYPNLFTPPGYVFSIWGVIYALAIVFMIYQVRPSQRSEAYLSQIGFLYLIGAVANNAEGLAGITWGCQIMPVRILNAEGIGYGLDGADGLHRRGGGAACPRESARGDPPRSGDAGSKRYPALRATPW